MNLGAATQGGIGQAAIGIPYGVTGSILTINGNTSLIGNLLIGTVGVVTIKSATSSLNWNLTLPTSAGTSSYVLQTDGFGNTSWVSQSGVQGPAGSGGGGTGSGSQGFQGSIGNQGSQGPIASTVSYFLQNGNSFGATAILGTTDNNPVQIISNNINALTITH